jgi:molecular chaperone DnaK (HSP70)
MLTFKIFLIIFCIFSSLASSQPNYRSKFKPTIIGINLGNTNNVISYFENKKINVIKNENDQTSNPMKLMFDADGFPVENEGDKDVATKIDNIVRIVGKSYNEI